MNPLKIALTLREAAGWLDPPLREDTLRHLVAAAELTAAGTRAAGPAGGKPARTYDLDDLTGLHAAFVDWLARSGRLIQPATTGTA